LIQPPLFSPNPDPTQLPGDCDNLTAIVEAARIAHMVRALQLTAIGAFLKRFNGKRMVAATHAALGWRCFSLWNGHEGTCLLS
jgi:hypothetical protein